MSDLDSAILSLPSDPTTYTPRDIESLIAYYRHQRETGGKPKKETAARTAKVDLASLKLVPSRPAVKALRR